MYRRRSADFLMRLSQMIHMLYLNIMRRPFSD